MCLYAHVSEHCTQTITMCTRMNAGTCVPTTAALSAHMYTLRHTQPPPAKHSTHSRSSKPQFASVVMPSSGAVSRSSKPCQVPTHFASSIPAHRHQIQFAPCVTKPAYASHSAVIARTHAAACGVMTPLRHNYYYYYYYCYYYYYYYYLYQNMC